MTWLGMGVACTYSSPPTMANLLSILSPLILNLALHLIQSLENRTMTSIWKWLFLHWKRQFCVYLVCCAYTADACHNWIRYYSEHSEQAATIWIREKGCKLSKILEFITFFRNARTAWQTTQKHMEFEGMIQLLTSQGLLWVRMLLTFPISHRAWLLHPPH